GRATPTEVAGQAELCLGDLVARAVLEAVDTYAVIMNEQRQIVAANPILIEALVREGVADQQGSRVGEAIECIHRAEGPDGCGTARACGRCGMMDAVAAAQRTGQAATSEWLISIRREGRWEAREFNVRALPLSVAGQGLMLVTFQDISSTKRRDALERVFIHDLMHSLEGLQGWVDMLQGAGAEPAVVAERLLDVAGHLKAEVESQHRLLLAESGEVVVDLRLVSPEQILGRLEESLAPEARARVLRLPSPAQTAPVRTDLAILCRVLGNMVQNALEALPPGGQAKLWYQVCSGQPTFFVQNPGCMAPEVVDRVFQRSFSTKAARGRGLGTYAMKVLGETVLGGKVGFTTNWEEGTRFHIELPG
ncbi:MAG: HAMP domain-containing histidine kinase, partial [Holophagaceae bacterium]|nr:HAMP domain-containing histidine kinase [Holophagaceae bacterium]